MRYQAYKRQDTANGVLGVGFARSTDEAGYLMRVKDGNKTVLTTYPKTDGEVLLKSRMREIGTFGSVRGLIVTSGLLPQTRGAL
jgi:hypothetical protein